MVTLIRLEAEAFDLETVVKDLDAAEAAVMALQKPDTDNVAPVGLNTGVTDEHYERVHAAETYFKGRRVLKFLGRAAWDDNRDLDKPQPRLASSLTFPGTNATAGPGFTSYSIT